MRAAPRRGARACAHFAAAEIGLEHPRIVPDLGRAMPAAMRAPASSTTMRSEMPITSGMSCSTRMTAMPRSAMRRMQPAERVLVGAHQAGGGLVEQQHARPHAPARARSRPAGDRHAAGRPPASTARRDSRRRQAAPRRRRVVRAWPARRRMLPSRPRRSATSTLSSTLMVAEQLRGLIGARDAGARDAPGRRAGQLGVAEPDAAAVGAVEPADHVEHGGLAGAVRADHAGDPPGRSRKG